MTAKTAFDLDSMSVRELTALRDAAESKRLEKLDAAKEAVLSETRARLAELGLTLEAVLPGRPVAGLERKTRKDAGAPLAVKFRGPNGEEWSGRGRLPKWLQTMEAEGKNREQFRV
jgi:DNA-binding protein H-NS